MPRELKPCGTYAAFRRHRRHGEEPCDPCWDAQGAYFRGGRQPVPRELRPCGTYAAYARHRKNGEEPCAPCREARRAYEYACKKRSREAGTAFADRQRGRAAKCGTLSGYQWHRRHGEESCEECRRCVAEYARAYRARKKAERDG